MHDFLEYIVKKIVENPENVSITQEEEEGAVRFHITVDPNDAGLVIGKEGKVINAIRNLIKIQAIKEGKRVYLDLTNEKPDRSGDALATELPEDEA